MENYIKKYQNYLNEVSTNTNGSTFKPKPMTSLKQFNRTFKNINNSILNDVDKLMDKTYRGRGKFEIADDMDIKEYFNLFSDYVERIDSLFLTGLEMYIDAKNREKIMDNQYNLETGIDYDQARDFVIEDNEEINEFWEKYWVNTKSQKVTDYLVFLLDGIKKFQSNI